MMRCLQDSMSNILMWVTIYDPFASNLGIDNNWNRLDYPWVFTVPLPFFLYVESLLCKPKFSILSYADCIHIVIPQTWNAESEDLHPILCHQPLTLLQYSKTTEYHENRVSIWLVYRIRRFIFCTIRNKLGLNPWNFNCCHSRRFQLYPPCQSCMILQHTDNSVPPRHLSYAPTRGIMIYHRRSYMQGQSWSTYFPVFHLCPALRVS